MEIDLVINSTKDVTGLSCYSSNLEKVLSKSKKMEVKEIDTSKNIPRVFLALKRFFPFDVKAALSINPIFIPLRKNSVVHLTSQYFALTLLFHKCRSVVTVHDLILFESSRKELFADKKFSYFNKLMLRLNLKALKKAGRIIADSEYTKKRIIEITGYSPDRISVVYLGVDKNEFKPLDIKRDPWTVLYVGSETPGKNIPVLIKAFAKLKKRLPQVKLMKVGLSQWPQSRKKLELLVSRLDLSDSVVFKDYCRDLALEYSKATLFVHPSIYEGFGLTVLEAMACGCPVICSNATSLPEIGGNAVIYFDPADPEELAQRMYSILTDEKLRKKLSKGGIVRAKDFSWEKTAEKTIEVYKKI